LKRVEIRIPDDLDSARADVALRRLLPDVPGWQVRDAFKRKDVKRGGMRIAPDAVVRTGDAVCVFLPDAAVGAPGLRIVMEDDAYIIVNKRQGMAVQGAGSVEALCSAHAGAPVCACHRLDAQTGGLVLLAKTDEALRAAVEAFGERKIGRFYHALVAGIPRKREETLRAYLKKDAGAAKVHVCDQARDGYVPIETRYRLLRAEKDVSLLEVGLITGKTHQIRAHLAHIGLPILGDDKYGDRALNRMYGKRKQCLWAVRLVLFDGRVFEVREEF